MAKAYEFKKKSEEAYISLQDTIKNEKKDWSTAAKRVSASSLKRMTSSDAVE